MKLLIKKSCLLMAAGFSMLFLQKVVASTPPTMVSPTVKLLDETGSSTVSGATAAVYMKIGAYYYSQGTTTNGALVIPNLTAGNSYQFYVDYNHGRNYLTATAGVDSVFFQTTKVSVNLKNCNGIITAGSGNVAIKGNIDGYYWNMGNTSSGVKSLYLLPNTYDFQMDYNHGRNNSSVAISGTTQDVDFTATCVKVRVNNCNGLVTTGSAANVSVKGNIDGYYWNMGNTTAGVLEINLLGGITYDFRMDYNHGRNEKSAAISGSSQNVDFTTTCVKVTVSNCNGIMTGGENPLGAISQSSPASFSLRKLRSDYSGNAIRIRRSCDNAETDIGFTTNGDLDTAAIKTFVSSACTNGDAYVTKWYDQSGNSRDAGQSNTGRQPRILKAGVVERQNGRPAIRFMGMNYGLFTSNFTAYSSGVSYNGVAKVNSNLTYNAIVNKTGASSKNVPAPLDFYNARFVVGTGSNYTFIDHTNSFNASKPLGIWTYQGTPGGNLNTYYNGSSNGSSSIGSHYSDAGQPLYIGSRADLVTGLDGWISEIVTFGAELSSTDRQILEGSQGAFYGISGPTAPSGGAVANVSIKGNIDGYFWNMGNTANGILDLNLLPNSYDFRMDYNHGRNTKTSVAISGTSQNVNFATTCVKVRVLDYQNNVISTTGANVSIKGNIDGYYWNMGNSVNGVVSISLLPETYDFRMDYNHGRNTKTSVAISGTDQNVDFATTRTNVKITDCNNALVTAGAGNVSIKGNIDGYYWNMGNTSAGVLALDLLPETYDISMSYNHYNNKTGGTAISGTSQDVPFTTTLVTINGSGISFKGNIDGYFWSFTNNSYLLPGSYVFKIGGIDANLTVSGCSLNQKAVVVKLLNSSGAGIAGGVVDAYVSSWTNGVGTTNSSGNALVLFPSSVNNAYFRMNYANASQQLGSYNINTTTTVTFQTKNVVVELRNSAGTLYNNEGTDIGYYASNWNAFGSGATSGGKCSMELLPVNYYFRLTYAYQTQQKGSINIASLGANPTITFQTTALTLKLNDAAGTGTHDATGLGYYSNGNWRTFSPSSTTNGVATMELLPGSYYFRMTYMDQTQQKGSMSVSGTSQTVDFQTTAVTLKLNDAAGTGTHDATDLAYYSNGNWHTFSPSSTTSGVATMELLPGSYYFRMTYEYQTQQQGSMSVSGTSQTVNFQTRAITLKLNNAAGTGTWDATSLGYYSNGAWHTFASGSTTGGTETMELLPGSYYFRMTYANQTQQVGSMTINADQTVDFQTVTVTQHLDDGTNNISGATCDYYSNGSWSSFGTTDANGNAVKELLPGSYYFRMNYNSYSKQKGSFLVNGTYNVSYVYTGSGINRTAQKDGKNPNTAGKDAQVNANEKVANQAASTEAAAGVVNAVAVNGLTAYPNPFTDNATVAYALNSAQNVQVEVYNTAGARIKMLVNENQAAGNHTVVLSASELAGGLYYIRVVTANGMKQIPVMVNK